MRTEYYLDSIKKIINLYESFVLFNTKFYCYLIKRDNKIK